MKELNSLTCLWHFLAWSTRWTIYKNLGFLIVVIYLENKEVAKSAGFHNNEGTKDMGDC